MEGQRPGQPEDAGHERPLPPSRESARVGTSPHIWVASLADFEHGIAHGAWINAAQTAQRLRADIRAVLDASPTPAERGKPASDWEIFDSHGFDTQVVPARPDVRTLSRLARGIARYGPAFAAWSEIVGHDNPEAQACFESIYLGHYRSIEDFGRDLLTRAGLLKELDNLPVGLRTYVDFAWERLAHDIWSSNDYFIAHATGGGFWIFDAAAQT